MYLDRSIDGVWWWIWREMRREKPHISIERNISTYYSPIRSADKSHIIDNKSTYIYFCKVFGRNYLVRLRPFGRSCRAMEPTMNRTACEKSIYVHGKQTINNNDCSSINNINNISIYNLSSLLWSSLFLFPPSFPISPFFYNNHQCLTSVFRRIFSFIWYLYNWQ